MCTLQFFMNAFLHNGSRAHVNKSNNIKWNPEKFTIGEKKCDTCTLRKKNHSHSFFYENFTINASIFIKTPLVKLTLKPSVIVLRAWNVEVRGRDEQSSPDPFAPEIPVPPAAAAERFPDSPAVGAAERTRPPAAERPDASDHLCSTRFNSRFISAALPLTPFLCKYVGC